MADTSSFDIVSDIDLQEVDNAVNQAKKEIAQRYDFKGSKAAIDFPAYSAVRFTGGTNTQTTGAMPSRRRIRRANMSLRRRTTFGGVTSS